MKRCLWLAILAALMTGTFAAADAAPPQAERIAHTLTRHGHSRGDEYYWLNQRDNPRVLDYLKAENAYTDARMAHTRPLQEKLFGEMAARLQPNESSVPYRENGYWYTTRYRPGEEYPVYCRRRDAKTGAEAVLLDGNRLAAGHAYFHLGDFDVSPNNRLLAYSVDTVSRRQYQIRIKDLRSGRLLPDVIQPADPTVLWGGDNRTLFYAVMDDTLRRFKIRRHLLGTPAGRDRDVFVETDETYEVSLERSQSRRYIFIVSSSTLQNETRYLEAARPQAEFTVFQPRTPGLLYRVDHLGDRFTILSNDRARNFRVLEAAANATGRENWRERVAHRADVLVEDFCLFRDFLVLSERAGGLSQLRVIANGDPVGYRLEFPEPAYLAELGENPDPDSDQLRYVYQSPLTPPCTYEFDMRTRRQRLLKSRRVPGYTPGLYTVERLAAPAYDGTLVPITLVRPGAAARDGRAPLLLYGYGAYGLNCEPEFAAELFSLLDRGFVYAIAHVRGGQEMGRWWYEDGKLFKKMNSFTDFLSCAEYLVRHGYARPGALCATGASAGGLLMGAVINLRPDLFRAVVAEVPYVDAVTTMLDPSIPLTTSEYDEWGDPNRPECYEYMLTYSPYDNVRAAEYPALLVTAGLHDSQVQYFEPAKWVARLRALQTGTRPLLLRTDMEAGHSGASGRYRRLRDQAFQYAFLLDQLGLGDDQPMRR